MNPLNFIIERDSSFEEVAKECGWSVDALEPSYQNQQMFENQDISNFTKITCEFGNKTGLSDKMPNFFRKSFNRIKLKGVFFDSKILTETDSSLELIEQLISESKDVKKVELESGEVGVVIFDSSKQLEVLNCLPLCFMDIPVDVENSFVKDGTTGGISISEEEGFFKGFDSQIASSLKKQPIYGEEPDMVIFLDTETSGFNSGSDHSPEVSSRVSQLNLLVFDNNQGTMTLNRNIGEKYKTKLSNNIQSFTHQDGKTGASFESRRKSIRALFGNLLRSNKKVLVVIQNSSFDEKMLAAQGIDIPFPIFCTLNAAKALSKKKENTVFKGFSQKVQFATIFNMDKDFIDIFNDLLHDAWLDCLTLSPIYARQFALISNRDTFRIDFPDEKCQEIKENHPMFFRVLDIIRNRDINVKASENEGIGDEICQELSKIQKEKEQNKRPSKAKLF